MVGSPAPLRGFDFDVHHNSAFMYNPLRYDNGSVVAIFVGKIDFDELSEFLEKETGSPFNGLYYTIPRTTLENGLMSLENNENVNVMYDIAYCYGKIDIYIDHFNDNLSEYIIKLNSGDVINNEEAAVIDNPLVDKPIEIVESKLDDKPGEIFESKLDDNNAVDKGKAKVDDTAVVDRDSDSVSAVDKGKAKVDDPAVVDRDSDSESEYDSDYVGGESDSESDTASIDHLSEWEEELKELRILKANAKKGPKPIPQPKLGVPKRSNDAQNDNPMMDAIGEHEEFMEELVKKLIGDEAVSDPFKADVNVEELPIHDEKTNWRLKKPIVSEKYTNAKQFKVVLDSH